MILQALILSLKITAIFFLFQEGNLLGWVKIIGDNVFDFFFGKKWSIYLLKPVWGCLACMSSLWTIILLMDQCMPLRHFFGLMLVVCGINAIISKILDI